MKRSVLFAASTSTHILNFHIPYMREYQRQGWEVHVGCGGAKKEIPCADKVMYLPFEKKMSSPENFKIAARLRRIIREEDYDLICVHTSLAAFFVRLALVGLKKRPLLVNMVHGYLFDDETPALKRTVLLAAERLTAPQTDLLLTMNDWDFHTARKYRLGKRVANVPGIGVDVTKMRRASDAECAALREKYAIPQDAFVLVYAAEFSKRKSQQVLLRAMAQLPERVILVLAGDGALLDACKQLAQTLGVAQRVIFPGYITQVGLWYQMADAAVTSSRSEGLPFNVMEAMVVETPVIASAVKGHTDLIREGETGLLYPYGDDHALAAQIIRLLQDPALREKLRFQAKEQMEQYALEQVLPLVMEQYGSVVPVAAVEAVPSDAN